METLSDQLSKCTTDKHIYRFLSKIKEKFINNPADIKKLLKQNFVGHLATVLSKRVQNEFQSDENNKIIDILLSILANCTYSNKDAANQVHSQHITNPLMTIINKSQNQILIAKSCRLIGNLVQNEQIAASFQQAGAALSLSNFLSDASMPMLTNMSLRAIRLMWNLRKFRMEILPFDVISKIFSCLDSALKSDLKAEKVTCKAEKVTFEVEKLTKVDNKPSNKTILKQTTSQDQLISKHKLLKIESKSEESKDKNSIHEEILAVPTSKDQLELIQTSLKLLMTISESSNLTTKIVKNIHTGINSLLFLIKESPIFRPTSLKILSNLSYIQNSQEFLGINNDLIPIISNLIMNQETFKFDEQKHCLEILCLATQNSCNRLKLKQNGMFKKLLSIAGTTKSQDELNLLIFAFFQYLYDEDSLNMLIQLDLINVLFKIIEDIVKDEKVDHVKICEDLEPNQKNRKRKNSESLNFCGFSKFMRVESNCNSSRRLGSSNWSSLDEFSPISSKFGFFHDYNANSSKFNPICNENEEKNDKKFDILEFIYNNEEICQKSNKNQEIGQKSNKNQENAQKSNKNQENTQKSNKNQEIGQKSNNNQENAQKSNNNQEIGQKSNKNQEIGQKSNKNQEIGRKSNKNQENAQKSNKNQEIGQKSNKNQEIGTKTQNIDKIDQLAEINQDSTPKIQNSTNKTTKPAPQQITTKNHPKTPKDIKSDNLKYILQLLWKISINHSNAKAFTNPKNLSILIKILSMVKNPHEKIYQILQNILEQTKNFVPIFMQQDFVFQIYDATSKDYQHSDCHSCDKLKSTRLQLLKDFQKVAESSYGEGQIVDSLMRGDLDVKMKIAVKLAFVVASVDILGKFLFDFGALNLILDAIYGDDEELSIAACNGLTMVSKNLNIQIPVEDNVFQRIIPDDFVVDDFLAGKNDVRFILKDGEIMFDKNILMASSEVFSSMFSGQFIESSKNEVKFPNYSILGMKYFLKLLKLSCDGKLKQIAPKINDMEVVLQAYELSILYNIKNLQQPLLNTIKVTLDAENVRKVFEWSIKNVNQELLISSVCYYLCGAVDGRTKVKLFCDMEESEYRREFKELIVDCILMKCKFDCN